MRSGAAFFALATGAWAQATYTNPIVSGKNGAADPEIVFDQGSYSLFYTSGWDTARRTSPNGVAYWTNQSIAYKGVSGDTGWAPTFRKDGDTWHMFTVGVHATSNSLGGDFTKQGNSPGFDPQYFLDPADGRHRFMAGGSHAGHFTAEMNSASSIGPKTGIYFLPATDWGGVWEGPYVERINGTYYMMLSSGSANGINYRLHYATAPTFDGPWTLQDDHHDAAFLRRSDHESIVGPGHHTMIKDNNGTFWIYYQQHNDSGGNYDRSIAVDPMWIDTSGVPHMRPTRGVANRPGLNSPVSAIWPVIPATGTVQAESYHGSRIAVLANEGSEVVVQNMRHSAFVSYRRVDFGTGQSSFTARVANGNTGVNAPASLEVRQGGVHGPVLGTLTVPNTGGWATYQTLTAPLLQTVSGIHDIVLVANGAIITAEHLRLDWFTFGGPVADIGFEPPVASADFAATSVNTPVTINLRANDSSPGGGILEVTTVGGNTVANRSRKASANNLVLHTGGTVTYTPPPDYWGTDEFFYALSDGLGGYARAMVTVHVHPEHVATFENGIATIEAEHFTRHLDYGDTVLWEIADSLPGHSGGAYVSTPDLGTSKWVGGNGGNARSSQLDYATELPAGFYWIWARVYAPNVNGNDAAIYFSTISDPVKRPDENMGWEIATTTYDEWTWLQVPARVSFNGGLARFGVRRGKDCLAIDRFLITDDPDFDPNATAVAPTIDTAPASLTRALGESGSFTVVPAGTPPFSGSFPITVTVTDIDGDTDSRILDHLVSPAPATTGHWIEDDGVVVLEAEHGTIRQNGDTVSWLVDTDGDVTYAYTPYGSASIPNSAAATLLEFEIEISTPGAYELTLRRNAPDGTSDSVFVLLNDSQIGGSQFTSTATNFAWINSRLALGELATGRHTLQIRRREAGMRIDRLMLGPATASFPTGTALGAAESPRGGVAPEPVGFDRWAAFHFTPSQLADATVSGPGAMPLGDGLPNRLKFLLARTAWERFTPLEMGDILPGGRPFWVFQCRHDAFDLGLQIKTTLDLTHWTSEPATYEMEVLGGDAERAFMRISSPSGVDAAKWFFRLEGVEAGE